MNKKKEKGKMETKWGKKYELVCVKTQDVLTVLVLVVWQPNNVLPKTNFSRKINIDIV